MCISWTIKDLMSLMHGITMKIIEMEFIKILHCNFLAGPFILLLRTLVLPGKGGFPRNKTLETVACRN